MKRVDDVITVKELQELSSRMYGTLVKADVDIARNIMLVDMDMHADGEAVLLEDGSRQEDIWGINLHPDKHGTDDFIEFDSMINIRPRQQNPSRSVLDDTIRQKIRDLVEAKIDE